MSHGLDAQKAAIKAFKDRLRQEVDRQGGVKKLAERAGMSQPSLSRFFNSTSRPQRATLASIAHALGLDDSEIFPEWMK